MARNAAFDLKYANKFIRTQYIKQDAKLSMYFFAFSPRSLQLKPFVKTKTQERQRLVMLMCHRSASICLYLSLC